MSTYNLNDNVNEYFEFILGGFTYRMKYPTVEETEQVQADIKKAREDKDEDKIAETMYRFISSENIEAPDIREALKKQNIKVMQNFNKMIESEFKA